MKGTAIYLSPLKPLILGPAIMAVGAFFGLMTQVWSLLVAFGLAGLVVLAMGLRFKARPILAVRGDSLVYGVFRSLSIPRHALRAVDFDRRRGFQFRLRDGSTRSFAPSVQAVPAVEVARRLDRWARSL